MRRCSADPAFNVPKIEVMPPTLRKAGEALPKGRHIPPMAPLTARLPRPVSHLPSIATVIDLMMEEGEMSMKHGEPSSVSPPRPELQSQMQIKASGGALSLRCRAGGRMTTGGSKLRPLVVANYQQSKESRTRRLKFTTTDSVRLQAWLTKLEPGELVPPQLVHTSQLMIHQGHIVQTMTAFVPWDSSLVDDGGRIVAQSETVDLDPSFSG
jgi:hypothetical protein